MANILQFSNTKKYLHIIWDWNGTLLNDASHCTDVLNVMLARRKLPAVNITKYRQLFDFPVTVFYERLGFDFTRESFASVANEYMDVYVSRLPGFHLHKNVPQVLKHLQDRGLTNSILSAYKQDKLEQAVNHFGLNDFFIRIYGASNHFAHSKLQAGKQWISQLQSLGYPPENILFIGDTLHDYEVACAMRIDCLLVSCGHQDKKRLLASPAPVCESISEAAHLLDLADNIRCV